MGEKCDKRFPGEISAFLLLAVILRNENFYKNIFPRIRFMNERDVKIFFIDHFIDFSNINKLFSRKHFRGFIDNGVTIFRYDNGPRIV